MSASAAPRRTLLGRLTAAIATLALIFVGLIGTTTPAAAITVDAPSISYEGTVNGDFVLVGNGVLQCVGLADGRTQANSGTCAQLHSGTQAANNNPQIVNDWFRMGNAQASPALQAAGASNSSVAQVTVPAGASIAHAHLYWSANTGVRNTPATPQRCGSLAPNATLPSGSYRTTAVKLQAGVGSPVVDVTPGELHEEPLASLPADQPQYYSASADVTSAFSGLASGSVQNIAVGNVWAATGPGCYAGWTLALVYDFGDLDLDNPLTYARKVILYDGHVRMFSATADQTVRFDGFQASGPGTRVGFNLYEGDRNIVGDFAAYATESQPAQVRVPRIGGATDNVGVSRADGSVGYTSATPWTNASVDVLSSALTTVNTGDEFVDLTLGTSGDSYLFQTAVLSVPVAAVRIDKSFNGTEDQQWRTGDAAPSFTITVTNTGSVPLDSSLTIIADGNAPDCERADVVDEVGGPALAPGQSFTYDCVGRAPGGAGYVNVVTVDATPVGLDTPVTASDISNVGLSRILLTKDASLQAGATPGDTVVFTFTATNTGDSILSDVTIDDPYPGLSEISYGAWPGASGVLGPNESVTATATYVLTQEDVNAGRIENAATTTGTDPLGAEVTDPADDALVIASAPAIDVTKSGVLDIDGDSAVPGDLITYTFDVVNTGNVTLTDVRLDDPLPGLSEITFGVWPNAPGVLDAGERVQATATYAITQDDINAGLVENTVTVAGDPPTGPPAVNEDTEIVPVPVDADIDIVKFGELDGTGAPLPGDLISYTFEVTNVGNATLFDVEVTDPLPGLSAISFGDWPDPAAPGTLTPGQSVLATATYPLTQADIDSGLVENLATTTGTPETGDPVTSDDPAETAIPRGPHIALEKTGALADGAIGQESDVVEFTFTATNTGNVTLTDVSITDDSLDGLSELSYDWPGTPGTLLPGQSVEATATYQLTLEDVNNGGVTNVATTTGTPPDDLEPPVDEDETTVPITSQPQIEIVKSGELADGAIGAPGDQIVYTFEVTNTGNVTLSGVTISDELEGISLISYGEWPAAEGVLDPGESVTATATYGVRGADADAGQVDNLASVIGTPPSGDPVDDEDPNTVFLEQIPGISIVKLGELPEDAEGAVGDVVTYGFLITNTGTVTLTDVTVTDELDGLSDITYDWPGEEGVLEARQTASASATYVLTQADLDNGGVDNVATATGTPPPGAGDPPSDEDEHEIPLEQNPSIEIEKSGGLDGADGEAGDEVTYTFVATNTGNVTLDDVEITDPLPGLSDVTYVTWEDAEGNAIDPGALPPGGVVTATATYTLTQDDVDNGRVDNTATAEGTPPGTDVPVDDTDDETVLVPAVPTISLVKDYDDLPDVVVAGDEVTFRFTVTNTGNVTLTGVTVDDQLEGLSGITFDEWPRDVDGTLQPGDEVTAFATYVLTQDDVDSGSIANSASTTGTPPGPEEPPTDEDEIIVPIPSDPAIELVKEAALAAGATGMVGDTVEYTFTATNTGNVTLDDVEITDPMTGLSDITYVSWVDADGAPVEPGTLPPGGVVTATATYLLTAADTDAGLVENTATVVGTPPTGGPVDDTDDAELPIDALPGIEIVKFGDLADDATNVAGDVIEYEFTLTNTGNVTLTDVTITDALEGLSEISYVWPGEDGVLEPGQDATATATYTLTQEDVDAAGVDNSADATGPPTRGEPPTDTDDHTVPITQLPQIGLVKTGELADGADRAGDVVTYTFVATNLGNVTLTEVTIADPLEGLSEIEYLTWEDAEGETIPAGTLPPGGVVTATATYTLTQDDVDAGQVTNLATAVGSPPLDGDPVEDEDGAIVPVPAAPQIELEKSSELANGAASVAGDEIEYTFTATNVGNVTLSEVTIDDPLEGLSELTYVSWVDADGEPIPAGTLPPGGVVTATATYVLTQDDVDAGAVENAATAFGTPPGEDEPVEHEDTNIQPVPQTASIELVKTGALDDPDTERSEPGDGVTYTFTATNSGTVTLTEVTITDPLDGLSEIAYVSWEDADGEPIPAGTLPPGGVVTATATYALTQADIDATGVDNTATAEGTPPSSMDIDPVTDADEEFVPAVTGPGIEIVKSGGLADGATAVAGDTVEYTFTVTNTGNVTLTDVVITDELEGLSEITYDWPGEPGVLEPDQSVTATATYALSQVDVDAGERENSASVEGTPPPGTGTPPTDDDTEIVPIPHLPSIDLLKTGVLVDGAAGEEGDIVEYTFTVTNTGNVTLTDVTIDDPLEGLSDIEFGDWPDAEGVLAPEESVTATATYVLTQADVDNGQVDNTATAAGTPSGDDVEPVEDTDDVTVPVEPGPGIDLVKQGSLRSGATSEVGDVVDYTFTVTNTGNVTLTGVTIDDPLEGLSEIVFEGWPGDAGVLAPGQSVTATATLVLAQGAFDAGQVVNTATATGAPPGGGDPVESDDTVTIPLPVAPAIDLEKSGELDGTNGSVGDVVTFTFVATNTGNVTLTGVVITDELAGLSAIAYNWPGEAGVLAPGEIVTATATYALTSADVSRGEVANSASVSGQPGPVGDPVEADDSTVVEVPPVPSQPPVADTGADISGITVLAIVLLLLTGAAMLVISRRRGSAH
ncbi:DUF7507 domain-containing protein [Pseudactinotalea sp.]|uniref:COG1361 S-layer family protein n=1 Tax=Pseudactinotalea sp. TaxID=1926260 RepID=UPI003B3B9A6E